MAMTHKINPHSGGSKLPVKGINRIKELLAAGLNSSEVRRMIVMEYDIQISQAMVSDIKNNIRLTEFITVTKEDEERISKLVDGEETEKESIPRLEKFGIALMFETVTVEEIISHYRTSLGLELTSEGVEEIVLQVSEWIRGGEVNGENEEWFTNKITTQT
jgi:hypothetical protein